MMYLLGVFLYIIIAKIAFLTLRLWDASPLIQELVDTGWISRESMKSWSDGYEQDSGVLVLTCAIFWPFTVVVSIIVVSVQSIWFMITTVKK